MESDEAASRKASDDNGQADDIDTAACPRHALRCVDRKEVCSRMLSIPEDGHAPYGPKEDQELDLVGRFPVAERV